MDNLGKLLYMATSALLFIFALTTSIYLYGTLHTYLEFATGITNVYNRVEGEAYEPTSSKRPIPWGEVYITLTNMDQMHVTRVKVNHGDSVEFDSSSDSISKLNSLSGTYENIKSYEVSGSEITYQI